MFQEELDSEAGFPKRGNGVLLLLLETEGGTQPLALGRGTPQ